MEQQGHVRGSPQTTELLIDLIIETFTAIADARFIAAALPRLTPEERSQLIVMVLTTPITRA